MTGGFGRPEFATLGQLTAAAAVEALGPRIEAILMALNERPFADKIVEARNRAGQSGGKLFRRNSFYPGGAGHIYAFQHGGRWEPQLNLGFFSRRRASGGTPSAPGSDSTWRRGRADREREAGQERVLAQFDRFQLLVSSEWRQLLTDWMAANGGFIQYGDQPPSVEMLPKDAVDVARDHEQRARARVGVLRPLALRRSAGGCGDDGERDEADEDARADVH